jgi:hypothetical protein
MAPVERSTVANATPETIWKACFEEMKFETWDPDVTDVSSDALDVMSCFVLFRIMFCYCNAHYKLLICYCITFSSLMYREGAKMELPSRLS